MDKEKLSYTFWNFVLPVTVGVSFAYTIMLYNSIKHFLRVLQSTY